MGLCTFVTLALLLCIVKTVTRSPFSFETRISTYFYLCSADGQMMRYVPRIAADAIDSDGVLIVCEGLEWCEGEGFKNRK